MPLADALSARPVAAPLQSPLAGLDPALVPIMHRESGGKPFVGYTPPGKPQVDLSNAPLDEHGFPKWAGNMGPQGISHAAGLFQIQPGTWAPIAKKLGIKDFSIESQIKVANELKRQEGLKPWAASEPGGAGGSRRMVGRLGGMGPQVPTAADDDKGKPKASDRLAKAVSPAPGIVAIEAAPAATSGSSPLPAAPPLNLRPSPVQQAPNLRGGYTDALASILAGKRPAIGPR